MIEQITMFSDPLEEKALDTLRYCAEHGGILYAFESHYGGMHGDYEFYFNPRDKTFYYSDRIFNSYRPEPWVRRKTFTEICNIFQEVNK